jgi:putative hemolysin
MTVVILAFGEITPKMLAKANAETLVLQMTSFVLILTFLLSPITKIAIKAQDHLSDDDDEKVTATEEELLQIVQTIEKEGVLEQEERELIESAIHFDDKTVREVMRPRANVIFLYDNATEEQILNVIKTHKYSRIPVISYETLQAVGILRERDVLDCLLNQQPIEIHKLIRPTIYISQRSKLQELLERLQKSREHLAIVIENSKSKNFVGLITLEDVLEEIVGEIYDEYDDLPTHVIEIGLHSFEIDGVVPIRQFFDDYLDQEPPKTRARNFATWVDELNGGKRLRAPKCFEVDNLVISVLKVMDGRAVKIELEVLSKLEEDI